LAAGLPGLAIVQASPALADTAPPPPGTSTGRAAGAYQESAYGSSSSNAVQGTASGSATQTGSSSEPAAIHIGETGKYNRSLGQSGMVWGVGNSSPVNALLAWPVGSFALLLLLDLLFVLRRPKKPDEQRPRFA
jgi:hypothetical protein